MFVVDGIDVLFRVALAILRGNEQELLECDSIPAVYVALESLPNRMWRSDKLLKVSVLYCAVILGLQVNTTSDGSVRLIYALSSSIQTFSGDARHIFRP